MTKYDVEDWKKGRDEVEDNGKLDAWRFNKIERKEINELRIKIVQKLALGIALKCTEVEKACVDEEE